MLQEISEVPTLKEEAIRIIRSLPDNCGLEDIQYELYVRSKIEKGLKDAEEGRVKSHEEVKKEFSEWLE